MAEDHSRLDSRFTSVSAFWKPGATEDVLNGTLSVDARNITFTTAPEYSRGIPDKSLVPSAFDTGAPERLTALHGFTQEGLCTLCELVEIDRPGLIHHDLKQSITAVSYRANLCVLGMHLGGFHDKCLTSARYTFTGLSDWVPKATRETWERDCIVLKIPLGEREIVSFALRESRVEVSLRAFPQLTSSRVDSSRVSKSVAYVEIRTPVPESLSWYLDIGNRLENLFSLLIGASVALETTFVYRGEESGTVVAKRVSRSRPFDPRECIMCSACQLADAMALWLSESREFRSVENVALGVVRRGKLFIETEFLSLAQALEGFHRVTAKTPVTDRASLRQVRRKIVELMKRENVDAALAERICASMSHVNDPTFAARLSELCQRLSDPLLTRMRIDSENFVADVVATRNLYTHAGSRRRGRRGKAPLSIPDIFMLNQKMRSLLRGVLLRHIGISESQFSDLLVREVTRWR